MRMWLCGGDGVSRVGVVWLWADGRLVAEKCDLEVADGLAKVQDYGHLTRVTRAGQATTTVCPAG
jgi:hypothetical protein